MFSPSNSTSTPQTVDPTLAVPGQNEDVRFTRFPKLPLELREMVWEYGCTAERVIDLSAGCISDMPEDYFDYRSGHNALPFMIKSLTYTVPPVLHTSRESRKIGLKHYTLGLGTDTECEIHGATGKVSTPPRHYINWGRDIIFPLPPRYISKKDSCILLPYDRKLESSLWEHLIYNQPNLRRLAFSGSGCSRFRYKAIVESMKICQLEAILVFPLNLEIHDILDEHRSAARVKFLDFTEELENQFREQVQMCERILDIFHFILTNLRIGMQENRSSESVQSGGEKSCKRFPECHRMVMTFETPDIVGRYRGLRGGLKKVGSSQE